MCVCVRMGEKNSRSGSFFGIEVVEGEAFGLGAVSRRDGLEAGALGG